MAADDIPLLPFEPIWKDDPFQRIEQTLWVWEEGIMINKPILFIPSIYTTFQKIILLSAHTKQGATDIKVTINLKENVISVWNNGNGIDMDRILANYFKSACVRFLTEFTVETARGDQQCKQVFERKEESWVTRTTFESSTCPKYFTISFRIDLEKFGMECLEGETLTLIKTCVFDVAGCSSLNVVLDASGPCPLPKSFIDYIDLYPTTSTRMYEKVNNRCEICVGTSYDDFKKVSLVDNIVHGGVHADYIIVQITAFLAREFNIKEDEIKRHLSVFINVHTDNPLEMDDKSNYELAPEFLMKVARTHLRKRGDVESLDILEIPSDALLADTHYSHLCTLIIVEGKSALEFPKHVLSTIGAQTHGILSLQGKVLNVRNANPDKVSANVEIQRLRKMLGLQDRVDENFNNLRYGKVMLMTDQDYDGSHIKGQIINIFHKLYPCLLRRENFLQVFRTPIIKAFTAKKEVLFYTLREYGKATLGNEYQVKHYKGLGCHNLKEANKYFLNRKDHLNQFIWDDDKLINDLVELAFGKKSIDKRKEWLREWLENPQLMDALDYEMREGPIPMSTFFETEYKESMVHIARRTVSSMMDGLNFARRKILQTAIERIKDESMKVDDLSSSVSDATLYRHGKDGLESTIKRMYHNNNIDLLFTLGQIDVQARYAECQLSPITEYIFRKDDERILNYLSEAGRSIEPAWFIPIIPMVLVNGSEGIGPGLKSLILKYNPRHIIDNLKRLLKGEAILDMLPWYKGFGGNIIKEGVSYKTEGVFTVDKENLRVKITHLPVNRTIDNQKEKFRKAYLQNNIKDYNVYVHETGVHFEITMTEDQMNKAEQEGFLKYLKLTTTLSTANMYVFDADGKLKKYDSPEKLLEDFYRLRLDSYEKRKTSLLQELKIASVQLEYKERFLREFWNGALNLSHKRKKQTCVELKKQEFKTLPQIESEVRKKTQEEEDVAVEGYTGYNYLLHNLFDKDEEELKEEKELKDKEFKHHTTITAKSLWEKDLASLEEQLAYAKYPYAKYTEEDKIA